MDAFLAIDLYVKSRFGYRGRVIPRHKICLYQTTFVGVLDIFGFEFFETNSFEQVCINLANEKLQFNFNEHIFVLELQTYEEEGIDVRRVTFDTNEPTLKLLEGKPSGILFLLDEEVKIGARGNDQNFLSKVLKEHGSHKSRATTTEAKFSTVFQH